MQDYLDKTYKYINKLKNFKGGRTYTFILTHVLDFYKYKNAFGEKIKQIVVFNTKIIKDYKDDHKLSININNQDDFELLKSIVMSDDNVIYHNSELVNFKTFTFNAQDDVPGYAPLSKAQNTINYNDCYFIYWKERSGFETNIWNIEFPRAINEQNQLLSASGQPIITKEIFSDPEFSLEKYPIQYNAVQTARKVAEGRRDQIYNEKYPQPLPEPTAELPVMPQQPLTPDEQKLQAWLTLKGLGSIRDKTPHNISLYTERMNKEIADGKWKYP